MKKKYLWVVGIVVFILFRVAIQLTGNALPNAIGYDLANLLFYAINTLAIIMVVIGALVIYLDRIHKTKMPEPTLPTKPEQSQQPESQAQPAEEIAPKIPTKTNSRKDLFIGIGIGIAVLGFVALGFVARIAWDMSSNKANSSTPAPAAKVDEADYFTIKEWGVRFPSAKSGVFSYGQPEDATTYETNGGPEDLRAVNVYVSGLSNKDNTCAPEKDGTFQSANIYRHKEQNPTINYQGTYKLNPYYQVKIGDWYYSTNGLSYTGLCYEGIPTISGDYIKLVNMFNENFKKLEVY
jgi:hypothetical protein